MFGSVQFSVGFLRLIARSLRPIARSLLQTGFVQVVAVRRLHFAMVAGRVQARRVEAGRYQAESLDGDRGQQTNEAADRTVAQNDPNRFGSLV